MRLKASCRLRLGDLIGPAFQRNDLVVTNLRRKRSGCLCRKQTQAVWLAELLPLLAIMARSVMSAVFSPSARKRRADRRVPDRSRFAWQGSYRVSREVLAHRRQHEPTAVEVALEQVAVERLVGHAVPGKTAGSGDSRRSVLVGVDGLLEDIVEGPGHKGVPRSGGKSSGGANVGHEHAVFRKIDRRAAIAAVHQPLAKAQDAAV